MATSVAAKASGNIGPSFLAAKAKRIRELMTAWAENTIDLGKELKSARGAFPEKARRGNHVEYDGWADWVKREFGLSPERAQTLIRIAEKFPSAPGGAFGSSAKLLDYLARETTPEIGRQEVIERIRKGEKIGEPQARKIVDQHRPKPKEANQIAKDTGKPTLASDGYLYLGASKEQAKETEERRTVVYAVRRAVETLATIEVSPHQFLKLALPHQLWNSKEEQQIERALKWITALSAAWEHHE